MPWLLKYLASFLKSEWAIEDYPIRFREQSGEGLDDAVPSWIAQIERWPTMRGYGNTKQEALANLRENLERYRANKPLPRPGTTVPLEFASTRYIDAYADIARDVLLKLYDLDYDSCFISDESTLWDFEDGVTLERPTLLVRELYGADISDLEKGNLVDVFDRIRLAQKKAPT